MTFGVFAFGIGLIPISISFDYVVSFFFFEERFVVCDELFEFFVRRFFVVEDERLNFFAGTNGVYYFDNKDIDSHGNWFEVITTVTKNVIS